MPTCPNCGKENTPEARFCSGCATPLAATERARGEVRKTVTVVFCDVTGSTALGERLDPEATRKVIGRYFEAMRGVLERHGGTVEKFIGDAVMAVFGIPVLHEDDALRAVRAAAEMRQALTQLNEELERDFALALQVRTGINTGEVVSGDPGAGQTLVTGDAVNTAARLEQAAQPGEILLGEATHSLVSEAIRAEPVEPLSLKGKSQPLTAYRVLDVLADVPAFTRRLDAPFVGREHELAQLREAFERAAAERACRLVTLLGSAGIGKSRLVRELLSTLSDRARFVVGRCLPYGEGITYWPLVEIVRQVAGDDARSAVARLLAGVEHDEVIAERLAGAIGQGEASGAPEETFWAVRRFLETLARERPLVVVLDDIQWAEATFLDLIEYLLGFSGDAPMLLLCVARPDVLEARPSWGSPRANATSLLLEPLAERESEALIDRLLTGMAISASLRERILEAAEGNPLFVEQMLAMQAEDGGSDGEVSVPPTIQALLAARIDRLEPDERAVIEHASVEGRLFHRGAVAELAPDSLRPVVATHLLTLVRKELIRPDRSEFAGDDGFRFAHILIRDAAYAAMPKETRADLHERFASWLGRMLGNRAAEYEEILGYHLEQAYRCRSELGQIDEQLAARAAERLASAGDRAFARADVPAAITLLGRAAGLLPRTSLERLEILPRLGSALTAAGELARAETVLEEAVQLGSEVGDPRLEWRARIEQLLLHLMTTPEGWTARAEREGRQAARTFTEAGDQLGLAKTTQLLAQIHWMHSRVADATKGFHEAAEHARLAGDEREFRQAIVWTGGASIIGPMPVSEAIGRHHEILAQLEGHPFDHQSVGAGLGSLYAMQGRFDEARELIGRARAALREFPQTSLAAATAVDQMAGAIEMLAGDAAAAERELRKACELLQEAGERGYLSTVLADLADAVYLQGRYDEAHRLTEESEQAAADDIASQLKLRGVRAMVLARRGDFGEAERLARQAVTLAESSDSLNQRGDAWLHLAVVLRLVGRIEHAAAAAEQALQAYEQKENLVSAARARALFEELHAGVS